METMKELKERQDREFQRAIMNDDEMPFIIYLQRHPELYEGVPIDSNTIEYLNHYFSEYNIKPRRFQNSYVTHLMIHAEAYNKMREVEFAEQIGDITTSHRVRTITGDVFSRVLRQGKQTRESTEGGTNTNEGGSKEANRQLPMNSTGTTFDGIVNWNNGASAINESKNNNTQTISNTINATDTRDLKDLSRQYTDDKIEDTEVNEQAVVLVERITKYLMQPKAIEWLIEKMKHCFILVY